MRVPEGVSGKNPVYDSSKVDLETIANELQLSVLGEFVPLDIKIDTKQLDKELSMFEDEWVEYLPRKDRYNNRQGMTLFTYPGYTHTDCPSLAEISYAQKKRVWEVDCNQPTELYEACASLHPLYELFDSMGRSFFVRCNKGGHFTPHRDHPALPRETFRLIAFTKNCNPYDYDFLLDHEKLQIEEGRVYYLNTRRVHRTMSWVDHSTHMIMNIPMNSYNVAQVMAHLQQRH